MAIWSAALLNTLAAPVFCFVPALAAITSMYALRRSPPALPGVGRLSALAAAVLGASGLTLAWYRLNYAAAFAYASWAYSWRFE